MHFSKLTTLLLSVLPALVASQSAIDTWVDTEKSIARTSLFRNVGNQGEFARGVQYAAVIASPSTSSPDYYYQWVRDSGMVFKVILNEYINGNTALEDLIKGYASQTNQLQRVSNPSGGYRTGGIGEPKFLVNGNAYTGGWGRPQTDGPAIRATVLIKYAMMKLDAGDTTYVKTNLYDGKFPSETPIKNDLEYVANYWTVNGFDLWEEVTGQHFFTLMVQYRALIEGAELANRLSDPSAADWYLQGAASIKTKLNSFWDNGKGFLVATLEHSRSGQDCGTLLGSLHGNGKRGFGVFPPTSDEVLLTLQALVDVMTPLYAINSQAGYPGIAIGRYPSDVYDGVGTSVAHPWFICTHTVAEVLYSAISGFTASGSIPVSSRAVNFYKKFYPSATAGSTYAAGSAGFNAITTGMFAYADTFVAVGQRHVMTNGSMSEQFSRYDGFQKGARDLTWSYASFLTMTASRANNLSF